MFRVPLFDQKQKPQHLQVLQAPYFSNSKNVQSQDHVYINLSFDHFQLLIFKCINLIKWSTAVCFVHLSKVYLNKGKLLLFLTLCSTLFCCALSKWTFISRLPSSFTRILLPTISLGKTKSSRMASCTAVSVRLNRREPNICYSAFNFIQLLLRNHSVYK